jgi:hypothetical protein
MELDYTVQGADGKSYGPVSLEQLSDWVRQGRVRPQQQIRRTDMEYWAPAGDFEELGPLFQERVAVATAIQPGSQSVSSAESAQTASRQVKSAGAWFYWVAGLSLIQCIASFTGMGLRFFLGLAVNRWVEAAGFRTGLGSATVLTLNLLIVGAFGALGVFAQRTQSWAFIVGIVLYSADAMLLLRVQDWIGMGFHVFVLYCLARGLVCCRHSPA